ncbi:SLBB domain-containing protein [Desulfococcaceae bacterium HSG7]|nr:SLBB domain-containing protein [Desulfococcaceae bacterium HSG7]
MNNFSLGIIGCMLLILLGLSPSTEALNKSDLKNVSVSAKTRNLHKAHFNKTTVSQNHKNNLKPYSFDYNKTNTGSKTEKIATVHTLEIIETDDTDNAGQANKINPSAAPVLHPKKTDTFKQNMPTDNVISEQIDTIGNDENIPVTAGDMLDILIPGHEKISRIYDVDPDGFIYVLNKIPAAGLYPSDVGKLLTKKLKNYLAKGDMIFVRIAQYKRYILIQGGVLYPGWYRMPAISNFDALLSAAGGVLKGVDLTEIKLIRQMEDSYQNNEGEIVLEPNDILDVPMPSDYKQLVDSGDLLFVTLPQEKGQAKDKVLISYDTQQGQNRIEVNRQGFISSPRFNLIQVNMNTTKDIENKIADRLPKYLKAASGISNVKVNIIEKRHFVKVVGNVNQPGWYRAPETANVQEVLKLAGGSGAGAIMSNIIIRRKNSEQKVKINLHLYKITGDIRLLHPLHSNDTLFVPIAPSFGNIQGEPMQIIPKETQAEPRKTVRIFGAVNTPGVFEPRNDEDILSLLTLAGGKSQNADLSNIKIIRDNKATEINLNQLLANFGKKGPPQLPEILPGDFVYVRPLQTVDAVGQDAAPVVRIFGAVTRAGIYEPKENLNLMDLLMMAHWGSNSADLSNINIIRGGSKKIDTFDLNRWLEAKKKNKAPPALPLINAGDTVYVNFGGSAGEFSNNIIYITGEVNSPGAFPLTPELTVIQAVTLAGGLGEWADADEITIIRMENGRQRNIRYNYEAAVNGRAFNANFKLRPNDTIVVP